MQRIGIITGMLASLFIFSGCEDKQETDLFKAQSCINTATAATVNSCLAQIEGDNSERAWVMRCSAAFISQGIDEDAIVVHNLNSNYIKLLSKKSGRYVGMDI